MGRVRASALSTLGPPPSNRRAPANGYLLPFEILLTPREFLDIAIFSIKVVKMATTNEQDRKKATGLQLALETVSQPSSQPRAANANFLTTKQQLLGLEKLGALPTPAADEIRNIVAEGIAEKFGETYRTFPCAREGTQIRRDAVPKPCSLRKSVQEFVAEAP